MELAEKAKRLSHVCESISPKEFYDYMMGETYTCDKLYLNDVLGSLAWIRLRLSHARE
ncbi:MAG: hypothetical protein QXX94_03525 [Candidatus Bathyarchaeia archaeon]